MRESLFELKELQERCERLREGNQKLANEVRALEQEREARAHAARSTLEVAAPGEVLILVTGTKVAPSQAPVSPAAQPKR